MKRAAIAAALTLAACGTPADTTLVVGDQPANDNTIRPVARWEHGEEYTPPTTTVTTVRVSRARRTNPQPRPQVQGDVFDALARCESGMNRYAVSRNGLYHSYFQWSLSTWRSLGYSGHPTEYDYATQKEAARRLVARSGWGQFPGCARKLGLR